ncbi:MAG: 16S rRNA (uracil(1498)-N(3))-methyltransferase [Nitrospirae bacterium]|nr:16S rRNA (uracil(1498)-N(3))-methyltransferase [Nitrospirota bacterium]
MNLIILFKDDFIDAKTVRLRGRRLMHVTTVQRASVGDSLRVGLLNGDIGTGVVTHLDEEYLEMDVKLGTRPPAALPLTLVLALPRPKVLRRILLSAGSMGVKKIFLINAYRVEKSYWQSPLLDPAAMNTQLLLGLEQARDTMLPEVLLRPLFKPFVEDELPAIIEGTLPLVAHPVASEPCPRQVREPVVLALGPEGGFIPFEIEKFLSLGFTSVHLGERILRVETAVPFIISRLL